MTACVLRGRLPSHLGVFLQPVGVWLAILSVSSRGASDVVHSAGQCFTWCLHRLQSLTPPGRLLSPPDGYPGVMMTRRTSAVSEIAGQGRIVAAMDGIMSYRLGAGMTSSSFFVIIVVSSVYSIKLGLGVF